MKRKLIFIAAVCSVFLLFVYQGCASKVGSSSDAGSPAGDSDTDSDSEWDQEETGFTVDAKISAKISTVGIVTWSVDHEPIDQAYIEFGLDQEYGTNAPVDLTEPNYRTLLLGMKPSLEYHFRIVAKDGEAVFKSGDYTLVTGPVTNFIPEPQVVTSDEGALAGGFIVTTTTIPMSCGYPMAFILDHEGELVWWYQVPLSETASARMSFDGERLGMVTANNAGDNGAIFVTSMDGLEAQTFNTVGATHDLAATPEGGFAFIDISSDVRKFPCGKVMELGLDGTTKEVYNLAVFFGGQGCHSNAIRYSLSEDVYTVGDRIFNTILKIGRSGDLIWALNGAKSDFTGTEFYGQHGHQLLADSILVFDNGDNRVLEYALDESNMKATEILRYESDVTSTFLGDVQRLPNGNTLVTYSSSGKIHEIDQDGNLLRVIDLGQAAIGYSEWRSTLYGPSEIFTM